MSDEIKPRGTPINAPLSMAKYRALKADLDEKVIAGEISAVEARERLRHFGGNLIAHEREQHDAEGGLGVSTGPPIVEY